MIFPRAIGVVPLLCILILVAPAILSAQTEYRWTVYSALNSAQGVTFDESGGLWVATTGGVVGYMPASDSFQIFHTRDEIFPQNEGLLSLNSTAIAFDPASGAMYVGSDDGLVSIRKKDGTWGYSAEISAMSERPSRTIRGFGFRGGRVYILTSFGIGVFNPADSSFIESYFRFGTIAQNTPVNAIAFWNGRIWSGTSRGLAHAPENANNLPAPAAWSIYELEETRSILSLTSFGDSLYVGTDSGAYVLGPKGFIVRGDLPRAPVRLAANGEHLAAVTAGTVFRYNGGSFQEIVGSPPDKVVAVAVAADGTVGVGFENRSMGIVENGKIEPREANSPAVNYFSDLTLASDGSVWTSHADPLDGVRDFAFALSRLQGETWTRFSTSNLPIGTNNVWNVGAARDNGVMIGSFRYGGTLVTPSDTGLRAERIDQTNSPARGIPNDPSFVVVGKAETDRSGRIWFTNYSGGSNGPKLLVKLLPGEESRNGTAYEAFDEPFGAARQVRWLAIDENGTKWMGVKEGNPLGLIYFNERGTLSDIADDEANIISTGEGLASPSISGLVVDQLGELWIATGSGVVVLVNPTSVVNNDARPVFRTIQPLRDIASRAIEVDALNRKWVGTEQGVFLLSSEGDQIIRKFTTENSPLVNNRIRTILSVDATGDIYIGTANGMNKVSTTAVESPEGASSLTVSPHPFVIPSAEPLRITGLPTNATVKIFGAGLTLVREFPSPGGAVALWDGLDDNGDPVPTGVYIIAASANSGDTAVLGKVAVIRR